MCLVDFKIQRRMRLSCFTQTLFSHLLVNIIQAGTDKEQIAITMTTPWEADNDLAEQENLFPEYLEMGERKFNRPGL